MIGKSCNEEIIRELAQKYDISEHMIKKIVGSIPRFITQELKKDQLSEFMIPYIGKIKTRPNVIYYRRKYRKQNGTI